MCFQICEISKFPNSEPPTTESLSVAVDKELFFIISLVGRRMSMAEDIDENEMEIANEEEDLEIDEDIDAVEQEELEENIDQDFVETNEPEVEEDHDINGNISVSPEEYQILVDKEIASLKYLLHQTKKEITQVKVSEYISTLVSFHFLYDILSLARECGFNRIINSKEISQYS